MANSLPMRSAPCALLTTDNSSRPKKTVDGVNEMCHHEFLVEQQQVALMTRLQAA